MTISNEHILYTIKADYLTVEEFAKVHNVPLTTVENWIEHAKLKNAKFSDDVWLIPLIENVPDEEFSFTQYLLLEGEESLKIEECPLLGLSSSVTVFYDYEVDHVKVSFYNWKEKLSESIALNLEVVEKIEYEIIISGKYETNGSAQFVPFLEKEHK